MGFASSYVLALMFLVQEPALVGPFQVNVSRDPITDDGSFSAVMGTIDDNWGIACSLNEPSSVTVAWRGRYARFTRPLLRGQSNRISYRFGSNAPVSALAILQNDAKELRMDTGDAEVFLTRFVSSGRLVMRDELDQDLPPRTAVFSYPPEITMQIIARVDAECGTAFSSPLPSAPVIPKENKLPATR